MVKYAFAPKLDPKGARKDTECTWECAFNIMITIVDFGDDWGICLCDMSEGIGGQNSPQISILLVFKAYSGAGISKIKSPITLTAPLK